MLLLVKICVAQLSFKKVKLELKKVAQFFCCAFRISWYVNRLNSEMECIVLLHLCPFYDSWCPDKSSWMSSGDFLQEVVCTFVAGYWVPELSGYSRLFTV